MHAARPKTLWAGVAPVLVGSAMAFADGHFSFAVCAATVFTVLMIQVGTNYANDYYDFVKGADTETRLGPVRATQAGLVSAAAMRRAFLLVFGLALVMGLYLAWRGGTAIIVIGLASIACGILYTAGPWPLAYLGLGDLFVLLFFGPVAVAGTYYLQANQIHSTVIMAGLSPGLISTALLTINNIRDYSTDTIAGKKTLVVRWGLTFGRAEYCSCLVIACLMPAFLSLYTQSHPYCNLALITLLLAWHPIRTLGRKPGPDTLNHLLAETGRLVLIYSLLFSIGWLL